ncbi:cytochrome P460 family protein [Methyloversatilis sp.]|uniref:cytochrome P460 family protein n=1 Tax=Methyloversatilis sp. TaxID=2569862 RepID=UPI0027346047|nr:cytochrome P460 family protein [Methyloversatilis sp.]
MRGAGPGLIVKQIRDIYMNPQARKATPGQAFPQGSTFVMGKNPGWGAGGPAVQKNGDWIYSAFKGTGELNGEATYDSCRTCHTPLKDKDYVFRYDEHFAVK